MRRCSHIGVGGLAAAIAAACIWQAAATPLAIYDEPLWYARSQRPIWLTDAPGDYFLATDVPGGCRLVYGTTLDALGLDDLPCRQPVYKVEAYGENWENACYAPADAVLAMRGCNVILYLSGLLALYAVAVSILKRPVWSLAAVSPLVLSPTFPVEIVPRVGPDALLMGTACLFLVTWHFLDSKGKAVCVRGALVMGALGGLCTFAKINGALAPIGFAVWLVGRGRRWQRLLLPVGTLAVAVTVFYLLNPAFLQQSPFEVFQDIIIRRQTVIGRLEETSGPMGWQAVWSEAVRVWALLPVFAVILWHVRRVRALEPVLYWGIALAAGNLLAINLPLPRYVGPVELGIYYPAALFLLHTLATRQPDIDTEEQSAGMPGQARD